MKTDMRHKKNTFELGSATVQVVRATEDLDKLFRGYYRCDVHPVGGPFFRCYLRARNREEAAHMALREYQIILES